MTNIPNTGTQHSPGHKPHPMIDLLVSIVIPSVILMKLSGDGDLGASTALIVALAFPVGWGMFELLKYKKFNFIALLGLISVLLTGGIGLLQLDLQWLAVKEAAIPGLIGIAVLVSTRTRYPLIKTLLYSPKIMDVSKIKRELNDRRNTAAFEGRLLNATYLLSGTFLFSATMNYILAKWIVTSPAGSAAFNEELGQMTLLSYPVIVIPSMFMTMAVLYYLWRTIHGMTGLALEEILVTHSSEGKHDNASG
ncbi:VC0807 family protein [Sulfuriflexus mobilis]|uniref:VC0807 family protein n=1 Tax=Sulfuriflexus mobilis TaxID=1811807 RepID=UPI000F82DE3A|nr:VC0807 family protein [Sulfuriflexus mobilis]